jgi:hypothetical protein
MAAGIAAMVEQPSARAADHLLAPSHLAVPLLQLFDLHRQQTDPEAAVAKVVWVAPAPGTSCQDGFACVVCLANCPATGSTIVQQLYVRPGPARGSTDAIDLSIFRPRP